MDNTIIPTLHPDSFLTKVVQGLPLVNRQGKELIRQLPCQRWDTDQRRWEPTTGTIAVIDNGNDAFKGAMPMRSIPFLATKRIPTAYVPAKKIRAGEGVLTWQVNNSEQFWIGEDALDTRKAESLPVGLSHERLPDARFQRYLAACQVELLIEAGYGQRDATGRLMGEWQGEFDMYVSIGLPPEEVDRNGVKPGVAQALRHIFNVPFNISRTDEDGHTTTWLIRFVELSPYAQSFASFASWYYTLDGVPIDTNIVRHVTLDIGGGQFHCCEVDLIRRSTSERPKLRMSAQQIGDGTIVIARGVRDALREQYYNIRLSDAEAQQALVRGIIPVGGREQEIDEIVKAVIAARADNLYSVMLPYLQEGQSFLMFTGGGSILLAKSLYQIVSSHRKPEDFFFVPRKVAPVLNAIGGLVLAQASAQKVIAQRRLGQDAASGAY